MGIVGKKEVKTNTTELVLIVIQQDRKGESENEPKENRGMVFLWENGFLVGKMVSFGKDGFVMGKARYSTFFTHFPLVS